MSNPVKNYPKEILKIIKKRAGSDYDKDLGLLSQFVLSHTPEGFEYWYDIFKKYDSQYEAELDKELEDKVEKMFLDEFIEEEKEKTTWNIEVVEPEEVRDSIVESVIEKFRGRSKAGFKKYGTNLDRKDLSPLEWLNHLQEELQDGILYAEKLKGEMEDKKETTYPLLKVENVVIKSPLGTMKFGVNEVSLKYSLDGKTITLDIV
jgi:hypothetical protein